MASTRARDRLVLCAKPPKPDAEERKPKQTPARWLLAGLAIAGDAFRYAAGTSGSWSGTVVIALPEIVAAAPVAPPAFADVAASARVSAPLLRQIAPAAAVMPLFRRSATELMTFAKDRDEHRRGYLLGIRPSPFAKANGAHGNGKSRCLSAPHVGGDRNLPEDVYRAPRGRPAIRLRNRGGRRNLNRFHLSPGK